jgi:cytidyltransferase-like protein
MEANQLGGKEMKQLTRVLCSGSFDLLHPGHVWLFNKCKEFGDILIVSISPDKNLITDENHPKFGSKRILSQEQRAYMVKNIKCVDGVVRQKNLSPPNNVKGALDDFSINVFVCVTDDPFLEEYKQLCKDMNIKFIEIKRHNQSFFNVSTTKIKRALQ